MENALISLTKEQEHLNTLHDVLSFNQKALDLSLQLYSGGETDFISVLDAQRSVFAAEDALLQSNINVTLDMIALYKAVGGGWEEDTR